MVWIVNHHGKIVGSSDSFSTKLLTVANIKEKTKNFDDRSLNFRRNSNEIYDSFTAVLCFDTSDGIPTKINLFRQNIIENLSELWATFFYKYELPSFTSFTLHSLLTLFTHYKSIKNHVFWKLFSFVDGLTSFGSKHQFAYRKIRRRFWRIHEAFSTTTGSKSRYNKMSLLFLQ